MVITVNTGARAMGVALLAAVSILTICASTARAELSAAQLGAIGAAVADKKAAEAEEAVDAKAIVSFDEQRGPKVKEMKVYDDQVPALRAAYDSLNADLRVHNADADRQKSVTAVHNGNCAGKTLPRPAFERCNGEAAQLNAWRDRVNARKDVLDRRTSVLNGKRDSIVARSKQLASELAQIDAKRQEAAQKLEQARKRIAALTSRLQAMCTRIPQSGSAEEIKANCGNVDFDGARKNLPPCDTDKCREYDRLMGGNR